MSDAITLLYCPFPTLDAARVAATTLLEAKLVACCNILPMGESHYVWQGVMTVATETILIAKTSADCVAEAQQQLAAIHPYASPAILSFTAQTTDAFAAWVMAALVNPAAADIG